MPNIRRQLLAINSIQSFFVGHGCPTYVEPQINPLPRALSAGIFPWGVFE